jgi:hypothetical protein
LVGLTAGEGARMSRLGLIVLILVACVGCASTLDPALIDTIKGARSCCSSLSQLRFHDLPASGRQRFSILPNDGAFDFQNGGLSFYRAFALPSGTGDVEITVDSTAMWDGGLFWGHAYFLDKDMQVIAQSSLDDLAWRPLEPFAPEHHIAVRMRLFERQQARYVVVHTPQDILARYRTVRGFVRENVSNVPDLQDYQDVAVYIEYPGVPVATGNSLEITILSLPK